MIWRIIFRVFAGAGIIGLPVAAVAVLYTGVEARVEDQRLYARARALHDRILTLDSHVDIHPDYTLSRQTDPGRLTDMQVDLPKMEKGGLDAAFFIVYVQQGPRTPEGYKASRETALRKFDMIRRMAGQLYPDQIEMAYTPGDVMRIHKAGRKVAITGIENGYIIGKDLSLLETYFDLGARYITLAHMGHNDIADSSNPRLDLGDAQVEHDGISAFGQEVIAEMNRLGYMVDVSHISRNAMMEALRLSTAPVIASHSSAAALTGHPRNLDDEQLAAIAAGGGVVQVVAFSEYVQADTSRSLARAQLHKEIARRAGDAQFSFRKHGGSRAYRDGLAKLDRRYPKANLETYIDHIDHAVKIMGIDHVGIASDFDGGGGVVGWDNAAETYNVTLALVRRGYSDADIEKLWGRNLLRVWSEVAQTATRLSNINKPSRSPSSLH